MNRDTKLHKFHPFTTKKVGDRVKILRHPASGDADGYYYGTLTEAGVVFDEVVPIRGADLDTDSICLIKA